MPSKEDFHLEEFKSLRKEIETKLKSRLALNRWGLTGLAAIYSYIFSNPTKPVLYLVPCFIAVFIHYLIKAELKTVKKAGDYIREKIEQHLAASDGWETYLDQKGKRAGVWRWEPLLGWKAVVVFTFIIFGIAHLWPEVLAQDWLQKVLAQNWLQKVLSVVYQAASWLQSKIIL